uniref:Ovule protein n=1 Tax=Panagrellus redivivus TaxID=6233 RepID=A0A7E4V2Q0_PANRE
MSVSGMLLEPFYPTQMAFKPRTSKFLQASDFEVSPSPGLRSFFKPRTSKFLQASDFEVSPSLGLRCFFKPRTSSPDGLQAPDFESRFLQVVSCNFWPTTFD